MRSFPFVFQALWFEATKAVMHGQPSQAPYAVSIMECADPTTEWPFMMCLTKCSGTLIGPSSVLTAAHCIAHATSHDRWKLYVAYSTKTQSPLTLAQSHTIAKVEKVAAHPDFGSNPAFPLDNDVAVVTLSECLKEAKGSVEWVKLATPDNPLDDSCSTVTIAGFGLTSNLPWNLETGDGKLREIVDNIHSDAACKDAYVKAAMAREGETTPALWMEKMMDSDSMRCSGGDSEGGLAGGEGGAGVIVKDPKSGQPVLVGVCTNGPDEFFGKSPEIWTRVARHYSWIRSQVQSCQPWKLSESLPPVTTELESINTDSGRCPKDKWQCPKSLECIEKTQVCDQTPHCADGYDERVPFCDPLDVFGDLKLEELKPAETESATHQTQSTTDAEFDKAVNAFEKELKDLAAKENAEARNVRRGMKGPKVVILPTLTDKHPLIGLKLEEAKAAAAINVAKKGEKFLPCRDVTQVLSELQKSFLSDFDKATIDKIESSCLEFDECRFKDDEIPEQFFDHRDMCQNLRKVKVWEATRKDWIPEFRAKHGQECISANQISKVSEDSETFITLLEAVLIAILAAIFALIP